MPARIIVVVLTVVSLPVFAQVIARPVVRVGDECIYEVVDNLRKDADGSPVRIAEQHGTVTAVAGDRITVAWEMKRLSEQGTADMKDNVSVYDGNMNRIEHGGRKFDPPFPTRFYPLAPGDERKDVRSSFPTRSGDGMVKVKFDGTTSDWEKTTVPAGTFEVLTIIWDGSVDVAKHGRYWSGRQYQRLSYSPATFCIVEGTYRNFRPDGNISADRGYRLAGFKSAAP